jgi:peptide/nickel transport system ATP-binding protein/oligopeptide transport system ATP-binding protein
MLQIQHLSVSFDTDEGFVRAVDDVTFDIQQGETLGLVGESGCGKSVTAMSILRLIPQPPGRRERGRILFDGMDLCRLPIQQLRRIRGRRIGMIFQEPMTALSPLHRTGRQMVEALRFHHAIPRREAWQHARQWLQKVGMPDAAERMYAYPFQLSGGMRQRVMIATAMMLDPELLIADEPTTALDVTIQAQILDLLREMKQNTGATVLLITHDMGVIWEMCTRVIVMYASEVVETGDTREVFGRPAHPYTEALLKSIPARAVPHQRLDTIPGQVPSPLDYPPGCRFNTRCPYAFDRCFNEHPPLSEVHKRQARCWLAGERTA